MELNGATIGFIILAIFALVSGFLVVATEDPVRAAIGLVVNFITIAVAYFMLGAEFLGITQVMVYAGAIMVLFLFVVMILKLGARRAELLDRRPFQKGAAWLIAGAIFLLLLRSVIGEQGFTAGAMDVPAGFGKPQVIGQVLFTSYVWPFLLASVLLLVGVVGSILLAKRKG